MCYNFAPMREIENGIGQPAPEISDNSSQIVKPLAELLGRKLVGHQKVAADILDSMGLSEDGKIDNFKYFVWQKGGASALKAFGDIREDALVSLWTRVMDNDELRRKYGIFHFLMQGDNFEILKRKKEGVRHSNIAIELDKPLRQVNHAVRGLVLAGLVNPAPANAEKSAEFRAFCNRIRDLINEDRSFEEIVTITNSTTYKVNDAAVLLHMIGEIEPMSHREIMNKIVQRSKPLRAEIRRLAALGYKPLQISRITNQPYQRIKYQLQRMRMEGNGPRFLRSREELRKRMVIVLGDYVLHYPGEQASLEVIRRDKRLRIGKSTANKIYHELEREGQKVPPIRKRRVFRP